MLNWVEYEKSFITSGLQVVENAFIRHRKTSQNRNICLPSAGRNEIKKRPLAF